jgi:hypothetical protein
MQTSEGCLVEVPNLALGLDQRSVSTCGLKEQLLLPCFFRSAGFEASLTDVEMARATLGLPIAGGAAEARRGGAMKESEDWAGGG